jgi:hypothetical protein
MRWISAIYSIGSLLKMCFSGFRYVSRIYAAFLIQAIQNRENWPIYFCPFFKKSWNTNGKLV